MSAGEVILGARAANNRSFGQEIQKEGELALSWHPAPGEDYEDSKHTRQALFVVNASEEMNGEMKKAEESGSKKRITENPPWNARILGFLG